MKETLKRAVNPIVYSLIHSLADLYNEGRRFLEKLDMSLACLEEMLS